MGRTLKSCIKLDYHVAKIKNKLTEFRKFWAGLCQISDSNSLHSYFKTFGKFWRATNDYCSGWKERKKKAKKKPWRPKNVDNGHLAPSKLTFLLIVIDRNGFRRMKEEGQIYQIASDFLIFAKGLSCDLSKFSDDFTPFFSPLKTITKSVDPLLPGTDQAFAKTKIFNHISFEYHGDLRPRVNMASRYPDLFPRRKVV